MEQLPDEILLHVFEYLPPFDLYNCAVVCHRFNNITVDNHLWIQHIERKKEILGLDSDDIISTTTQSGKQTARRRQASQQHDTPAFKELFKKDIESHLASEEQNIWNKNVASRVKQGCGGCFFWIACALFAISLLIWIFIHNGEHGTSTEFRESFNTNWGEYCKASNGPPSIGSGNDWVTVIILLIVIIIWSPYIIMCWIYPSFYYLLFAAEAVLGFVGKICFGWMFSRGNWRLEEHKTTSVFLGGNTILLVIIATTVVALVRALVSYYKKKQTLRRRVMLTLKG